MKIKSALLVTSTLVFAAITADAATMFVSNVAVGPGDTLYASSNNSLMNGGVVTMGYFAEGITDAQLDSIPKLVAQLAIPGNYTLVTSAVPGAAGPTLSGAFAGYADQELATSIGVITGTNALLGRTVYSIITDAGSLASVTLNSQFALINLGPIKDDVPDENQYSSNPTGRVPVLGTFGAFNGDAGGGDGGYATLQMIPEPSAALLGALGVLGLLRRRRN
jgi:hypothetical protein